MKTRPACLALADGTVFSGRAFGAFESVVGETVFTTGMTGYQEVLTDPSYCGQLVTMTAPQIGNTGVNREDPESRDGKPQVSGFVVRDASTTVSNYRSEQSLEDYFAEHGIAALTGVDTRRLTRHLRDHGSQNGCIGSEPKDILIDRAKSAPQMEGLDLVSRVTPTAGYTFSGSRGPWAVPIGTREARSERRVVALDLGAKQNILRCLADTGCQVEAVPAQTSAQEILGREPDGIFISNGPGDPAAVTYVVQTIRQLLGEKPVFGICLGHELLALALGASTYKLKFGHRGLNQPVKDLSTGRVEITSQNHGFVVDVDSLKGRAKTTHLHLNDGTSEGLEVLDAKAFSVQYHPEAAAGPHDSLYLFRRFIELMDENA